jgi:hypothetical protein
MMGKSDPSGYEKESTDGTPGAEVRGAMALADQRSTEAIAAYDIYLEGIDCANQPP